MSYTRVLDAIKITKLSSVKYGPVAYAVQGATKRELAPKSINRWELWGSHNQIINSYVFVYIWCLLQHAFMSMIYDLQSEDLCACLWPYNFILKQHLLLGVRFRKWHLVCIFWFHISHGRRWISFWHSSTPLSLLRSTFILETYILQFVTWAAYTFKLLRKLKCRKSCII